LLSSAKDERVAPAIAQIARHDRELAKQLSPSNSSVILNVGSEEDFNPVVSLASDGTRLRIERRALPSGSMKRPTEQVATAIVICLCKAAVRIPEKYKWSTACAAQRCVVGSGFVGSQGP
jgi:hypothetical protein